jgi:hypothetical protein
MAVQIQYEGFLCASACRVYQFVVNDTSLGLSRKFTVKVQSQTFCSSPLKFQDGPPISFERLKQELESESQEKHADVNLTIGQFDIQGYLERHYPRKGTHKKVHAA